MVGKGTLLGSFQYPNQSSLHKIITWRIMHTKTSLVLAWKPVKIPSRFQPIFSWISKLWILLVFDTENFVGQYTATEVLSLGTVVLPWLVIIENVPYIISSHFIMALVGTRWDRSVYSDIHRGFTGISFLLCHILLSGFRMLSTHHHYQNTW